MLRPLVLQAFELRGTPYLVDAARAIVEAWERRPLTELEWRAEIAASTVVAIEQECREAGAA